MAESHQERGEPLMKLLIKNGRVIDPASKTDVVSDLLIEDGRIAKISKQIKP